MEKKTVNIRVHGIDLIEKNLYRAVIKDSDQFLFDTKVQTAVNNEQSLVVVFASVDVRRHDGNDLLANLVCGFGFQIDNFQDFGKDVNGSYIIPPEIETMLRNISISTLRGILFSELKGTPLHRAILPIISLDSFKPTEGNIINIAAKQPS